MLLVLIVAQMSIVWEVYRNLDSSFTDQVAQVVNGLCYAGSEATAASRVVSSEATALVEATVSATRRQNVSAPSMEATHMDQVNQASNMTLGVLDSPIASDGLRTTTSVVEQGSRALRELCNCTTLSLPRYCIAEWILRQWEYALGVIGLVFIFEGVCACLAWTFVDALDHDRLEAKRKREETQQQKKGSGRKANRAPGWGVVSQSLRTITTLSEPVVRKAEHEVRLPLANH